MNFKEIVGIDVSKKTLDVHLHKKGLHRQFLNNTKDINKLIKWVLSKAQIPEENILFVFEHTGMYSDLLAAILSESEINFSIVSGLEIKRSMGIVRGKTDQKDAAMIARYGYRLREEIKLTQMPAQELLSLKRLLKLRDRLVKQSAGFKASYGEQKERLKLKDNKTLLNTQKQMIGLLSKKISKVEKAIQGIIESNREINDLYDLVTSVTGIGKVTTWYLLAFTTGFTKFDTWRQFASYSGIAPFQKSSGTSIRGKTKVSSLANKKIKSLLDLCAKNAIQHSPEMRKFYQRKVESGKNKMSTINIIRNKLVARIFAVVKRGTPYVEIAKYAA